jgi:hypothetical protein
MGEAIALEFVDPNGDPLRIEWRADALAALDPAGSGQLPPWRLGGELDWDEVSELRLLSGRLGDRRLLAVAALRPAEAEGHGDEVVAGASGSVDSLERLGETLLSTEYGPEGEPRRIGLELYRADGGMPLRVAGDATAVASSLEGGVARTSAALELRAAGDLGVGVLDILRRG